MILWPSRESVQQPQEEFGPDSRAILGSDVGAQVLSLYRMCCMIALLCFYLLLGSPLLL